METDKCCGAEGVVGWRWLWGGGGAMWGDVGLGPQSGCLIMEADKGCGAEVGRCGVMWGWDPQVVVLYWRQIRAVGRRGLRGEGGCGVEVGRCGAEWGWMWGDLGRCGAGTPKWLPYNGGR